MERVGFAELRELLRAKLFVLEDQGQFDHKQLLAGSTDALHLMAGRPSWQFWPILRVLRFTYFYKVIEFSIIIVVLNTVWKLGSKTCNNKVQTVGYTSLVTAAPRFTSKQLCFKFCIPLFGFSTVGIFAYSTWWERRPVETKGEEIDLGVIRTFRKFVCSW